MPYPPLSLVKRLPLGRKVTPAEEDQNLTDIETAVNSQLASLSVALNPDGTLKTGSVATNAIQNRAVTQAKLDFLALFYAVDTGAANAMVISFTPAFTAYGAGNIFWVKAAATNTGPTTINVDSVGLKLVKAFIGGTLSDLGPGQIIAGNIYELAYDGTQFLVSNPSSGVAALSDVYASSGDTAETTLDIDLSLALPAGAISWTAVELSSICILDSAAASPASTATTLKWNCGGLLNTAVTLSPSTGAGNSGQVFGVNGDNQTYPLTVFAGVVPDAIKAVNPLIVRASFLSGGSIDLGTWRFWAKASCK